MWTRFCNDAVIRAGRLFRFVTHLVILNIMKAKLNLSLIVGALALANSPVDAVTVNYTVSASANISSAGLLSPVDPGGGGAGTLPVFHAIAPGQTTFTFSASGQISQLFESFYHSSDGLEGYPMDSASYGGISGFRADVNTPLVGVFLSGSSPAAPAPSTLDFTSAGLGLNFSSLSPQLGQVFFIGDGKTSGNLDQIFNAPSGATRLFLGFADAPFSVGAPGAFDDNRGSLAVAVTTVPEPGTISFLLSGLAFAFLRRRQRDY